MKKNQRAFPAVTVERGGGGAPGPSTRTYHAGMTLRQWLAGQALQGIMASGGRGGPNATDAVCREACALADGMLSRLEEDEA